MQSLTGNPLTTKKQFLARISSARIVVQRVGAVWLIVALLYLISGLFSPGMFQVSQVLNILQVAAFLGVVATGQTLALLAGGIDLSVAGVVTMANIVSTGLMAGRDGNMFIAIATCILLAAVVGLINGLMITFVRVAPLIATLGMNSILFGAALVYTNGAPHGGISPGFAIFGQGHLMAFPVSAICWLVVALSIAWITRRTVFGRQLYAVGASATAAQMMGIPTRRIVIIAYILSSVMAVLGGLLLTSYIGSPSLGIGDQFLFSSIASTLFWGPAFTRGT